MIDSKSLIKEYKLSPNKALGQNFLIDESSIRRIIELADPHGRPVLEIGPGLGALTDELCLNSGRVVAVELDSRMSWLLKERLSARTNLTILNCDFLRLKNEEIVEMFGDSFIVVSNLPYYITTPASMKLIDSALPIERMVLMMQYEASKHFTACPKEKCYTPISVVSGRYYSVTPEFRLSPSAYYPEPEVDSVVLRFERNSVPYDPLFTRVVKASFAMRRKTLKNNLASLADKSIVPELILSAGLEPSCRAEELSISDYERLFVCFKGYLNDKTASEHQD